MEVSGVEPMTQQEQWLQNETYRMQGERFDAIEARLAHLGQQAAPPEAAPERATRVCTCEEGHKQMHDGWLDTPGNWHQIDCPNLRAPWKPTTAPVPECAHRRRYELLHSREEWPQNEDWWCRNCGALCEQGKVVSPAASPSAVQGEERRAAVLALKLAGQWLAMPEHSHVTVDSEILPAINAALVGLASSSPTATAQRGEAYCQKRTGHNGRHGPADPETPTNFPCLIAYDPLPAQTEPGERAKDESGWWPLNAARDNLDRRAFRHTHVSHVHVGGESWHQHGPAPTPPSPAPECAHPARMLRVSNRLRSTLDPRPKSVWLTCECGWGSGWLDIPEPPSLPTKGEG